MRGDVHRLRAPRDARRHEQRGARYAVVIQSDELLVSTLIVAPTSRSARPEPYRPTVSVADEDTQVMAEQLIAVAPERLGDVVGHLTHTELADVTDAVRLVLALD